MKNLAKGILIIGILLAGSIYLRVGRHWFDNALFISDKYETIEVTPQRWACDCADWLETRYLSQNVDEQLNEQRSIFIEAAPGRKKIPDGISLRRVQLYGRYYIDKGISRDYALKGDMRPTHAKVFRYDRYVVLEK